jgi:hypothetical protein
MTKLKYIKSKNRIMVFGYEPYFSKFVSVATIYLPQEDNNRLISDNEKYYISHCHGYFPKHDYGLRVIKYCKINLK